MNSLIDKQIEVLQAFKEGKKIEWRIRARESAQWRTYTGRGTLWDWGLSEYRVKPEPRTFTLWRLAGSHAAWQVATEGTEIHPEHEQMKVQEIV